MSDYPDDDDLAALAAMDPLVHKGDAILNRAAELWCTDYGRVDADQIQTYGSRRWTFITGGWSGNDDIIAALDKIQLFNMLYWFSSERGGKHVYEVRFRTRGHLAQHTRHTGELPP